MQPAGLPHLSTLVVLLEVGRPACLVHPRGGAAAAVSAVTANALDACALLV